MSYAAITQPTAEWLLGNKEWMSALFESTSELLATTQLRNAVLIAGHLRVALSADTKILAIWHPDYLSNTGAEPWGFVRLTGAHGILASHTSDEVFEVFERCLYVINQRLQGLLLDTRYIHKTDGNVHTCLAGRGVHARQLSVAYVETELSLAAAKYRTLVCVGPARDRAALHAAATRELHTLPVLAKAANAVVRAGVLRAPLEGLPAPLTGVLRAQQQARALDRPITAFPPLSGGDIESDKVYETLDWSYDEWVRPGSTLTQEQRRILESDVLLQQPVRLIGAAGSGKTLLMQLLALRRLHAAADDGQELRILYVVHNKAMMESIWTRFVTLGAASFLDERSAIALEVRTLFDYSRTVLGIEQPYVIDPDAQATKVFQQEVANEAIAQVFRRRAADVHTLVDAPLLSAVAGLDALRTLFCELVVGEIGVAIKGHGLERDRARYVGLERPLSALHGVLSSLERDVLFDIFEEYYRTMFETLEVLDTDDLAISLLGRMRTPIWEMKRKKQGYDFVLVDETQLFNENERRVFPLLTRGDKGYVPIALALDQAQELRGTTSAGLGLLGIRAIADEQLTAIQRSTAAIARLAFNVIQHTTDLFGPEFPDFTRGAEAVISDSHHLAARPRLAVPKEPASSLGKFVLKQVREFRAAQLRQIAVIVHAEEYWVEVRERLMSAGLPLQVLATRGERVDWRGPVVVLAQPAQVGGQEFDGVIVVGLEQGRVPPRVQANEALAAALEQRALREIYVSFTRARYRLVVANSAGSAVSRLLQDALRAGLLEQSGSGD